jgi:hypothetical protein
MTLIIQKPTGAKLVLRKELPADAEADAYIAAVEAADGQALEPGVKFAIKNFVLCCKDDGIWPAIKASCILAGARTLAGALVPLVGTAPTNGGGLFVSGDYNRKTGLVGNGSTKYLNSNRNNNADPQNSNHNSIYITVANASGTTGFMGTDSFNETGANLISQSSFNRNLVFRNRQSTSVGLNNSTAQLGLLGVSRSVSTGISVRLNSAESALSSTSQTPANKNLLIYRNDLVNGYSNFCLAFYSIGESLDLALLDARVTDLINAFAAAIP